MTVAQCETVLSRHSRKVQRRQRHPPHRRRLDAELFDTRAAAVGTLCGYMEDTAGSACIEGAMRDAMPNQHRAYPAFLERALPAAGEARAAAAVRLSRTMGAMQSSADETDADGLTPLMRAPRLQQAASAPETPGMPCTES